MCTWVCVYFKCPIGLSLIVPFRCSTHCLVHSGVALLAPFGYIVPAGSLKFRCALISGKRQKLPAKRGQANEDPSPNFDVTRFINEGAADRFGTICKNRSFIKEKGFHYPNDFFRKTIAAKGWRALFQPPHPAAMSVVREFYANLASHVVKKVRVWGVLVDFSAESINHFIILIMSPQSLLIDFTSDPITPRSFGS